MASEARQEWRTPKYLFDVLNNEFSFTIDAAANDDNHLLPRYWTKEQDALSQNWSGERIFCNPPYSKLGAWVEKAYRSDHEIAVLLLPVRTDTDWWVKYRKHASAHYFRGRVNFDPPPDVKPSSNFERSVLMVFGDASPGARRFRDAKTGLYI